jgi:Fur family ferric uptake transcriptional regulator
VSGQQQLVGQLRQAGHRLTGPRCLIVELIAERDGHFTSGELLQRVASVAPQIGRATVFRTIELLLSLGLLERVHSGTARGDTYVVSHAGHHHHLICSHCGAVTPTAGCTISDAVAALARQAGYVAERHWLEIVGRCPRCSTAEGS